MAVLVGWDTVFELGLRRVAGVKVFLGLGFRHLGLADDVL